MCTSDVSAAVATSVAAVTSALNLTLITTPALGATVYVKRGGSYVWCNGTTPTTTAPCEPGATATSAVPSTGPLSLVVVCPPAICLTGHACAANVSMVMSEDQAPEGFMLKEYATNKRARYT